MTDAEIIDLLWEQASRVLFVTKEQFADSLDGWHLGTIYDAGELVVITVTKGPEFHFRTLGRPVSRKIVRETMEAIIAAHGHVITRTPKEEERQHRFNRVIGFEPVGEDELDIHYRMERFGSRSMPCPS